MNAINFFTLTASLPPSPEAAQPTLGQRLQSIWGQVVYGVTWFFTHLSPAFVWAVIGLAICLAFFIYYWHCLRPRPHSLEWIAMAERRSKPWRMTLTLRRYPFAKKDVLPMLLITVIYAVTAFFRLGSFSAPQTYTVFQQDTAYTFSFSQPVTVDRLSFYTSLGTGHYTFEWQTEDGTWQSIRPEQLYNSLFKWHVLDLNSNVDQNGLEITQANKNEGSPAFGPITAQLFRVSARTIHREEGLWLAELALWSGDQPLVPQYVSPGGEALFDETNLWADKATYMNSTYFDEIYHPRTALEHLKNVYPYEVSHPPLGKLILSVGVWLFGMTPFGWRFMGTLFGVLMLPILYVFLKNLFGRTAAAACGTCLFAFDFMHLVQTRIATIDTYGVFFILVSYYFMYRWLTVPAGSKLRRSVLPLFLCGLFWGIGCASKWTVVYAGAGLAVLWLLGLIFKGREWPRQAGSPRFGAHVAGTIALSVVFFVILPLCIYTISYFPYATAKGNTAGFFGMLGEMFAWPFTKLPEYLGRLPEYLDNLTRASAEGTRPGAIDGFFRLIPGDSANPVDIMMKNQHFMLTYHQGVHTPHPYESYWYQWIFDGRPILYYRDLDVPGMRSLFASFNNPLVSWAGLLSVFGVLIQTVRRRSGVGLFILIALLSQFIPWLPIGRILFAYHYFPTVLFLVFCITYLINGMLARRRRGYQLAVYGYTGCTVALYAIFYPALIGLYMPNWYSEAFLRWFPSWPL